MKNHFLAAIAAAAILIPVAGPSAAMAQHRTSTNHHRLPVAHHDNRWQGDRTSKWDPADHYRAGKYRERRLGRNDHIYRGRDGRYYCRRGDGTTGLVIGAIGGGVLGNVIGGGTLGTLVGAGGGALLGRSIDRGNIKCR